MTIFRIWILSVVAVLVLAIGIRSSHTDAKLATEPDRNVSIVIDANFTPFIDEAALSGTNRVTLENDTTESFGVSLYFVPDEVLADLIDREGTPEADASGLPLWLADAQAVGGPGIAGPGSSSGAILDLNAGSYVLVFSFFPLEAGQLPSVLLSFDDGLPFVLDVVQSDEPDGTPVPVTRTALAVLPTEEDPTGDPIELTEEPDEATEQPTGSDDGSEESPPVTATIVMTDAGFQIPGAFASGPQTWEIVNQGQLPHALIVVAIPDGTTPEQLMSALFPGSDQAAVAAFDTSAMINVGGLGPLAPGLSAGATFDLASGTYAMFSALPDPVTGQPDGAQGLLAVFVVGG